MAISSDKAAVVAAALMAYGEAQAPDEAAYAFMGRAKSPAERLGCALGGLVGLHPMGPGNKNSTRRYSELTRLHTIF